MTEEEPYPDKAQLRREIEAQVRDFEKNGGKIKIVPMGATAYNSKNEWKRVPHHVAKLAGLTPREVFSYAARRAGCSVSDMVAETKNETVSDIRAAAFLLCCKHEFSIRTVAKAAGISMPVARQSLRNATDGRTANNNVRYWCTELRRGIKEW